MCRTSSASPKRGGESSAASASSPGGFPAGRWSIIAGTATCSTSPSQRWASAIASQLDVRADRVIATVDLPPFLALFADKLKAKLAKEAPKLLR